MRLTASVAKSARVRLGSIAELRAIKVDRSTTTNTEAGRVRLSCNVGATLEVYYDRHLELPGPIYGETPARKELFCLVTRSWRQRTACASDAWRHRVATYKSARHR